MHIHQLGGAAFVLGNLLFIGNKLNDMNRLWLGGQMADVISGEDVGLIVVGQVALILGYIALYRFYAPKATGSGRYALRLLCGGGTLLAIGHISFMSGLPPWAEALFALVLLGTFLLLIGLIWFGLVNLRQPILRWGWLPLFAGLMGAIGFFGLNTEQTRAIFLVFRTLFALGLMGLGLGLWLEKAKSETSRMG